MKRVLVKLDKKNFAAEIGGKKVVSIGGSFFCYKCGYKMIPEITITGKGNLQRAEFYVDTACHCDGN